MHDILDVEYINIFQNGVDARVDQFLTAHGIARDDNGYNEVRQLLLDTRLPNADTGEGISDDLWHASAANRTDADAIEQRAMYDVIQERIDTWQQSHTDTTSENPTNNKKADIVGERISPEEWAEEKENFEKSCGSALNAYAILAAERSTHMLESADTREAIDHQKEEVSVLISILATQMMDELEATGKTPDEIAQAIDVFVNEQADIIMAQMEQRRFDKYEKSSGFMKRIYSRWAKWTEQSTDPTTGKAKFFSSGRAKKIAALSVPAAAVGVGAGLLMPVAASVGVSVAVAGVRSQAHDRLVAN